MFDEEFYQGQLRPGQANFKLFELFNGGIEHDSPLLIGTLPALVRDKLGWPTSDIYAHRSFAQKARFHPQHGMKFFQFELVARTILNGNIFVEKDRGGGLAAIFALPFETKKQMKYVYVPCYLEMKFGGRGIFARTMMIRSISQGKFDRMDCLWRRAPQTARAA